MENSDTDFFASTCLSGTQITIETPFNRHDCIYLHYHVECNDGGPIPVLDALKNLNWLLKAAYLWKNLFEAVPDGYDVTPVPFKLSFCVEGYENYGELDLKDTKLLEKLEASGELTSYLALTSKTVSTRRTVRIISFS